MTSRNLHFQRRCLNILTEIWEVGGMLDAPTVHARHFPEDTTGRACQRRLRMFADHDLVTPLKVSMTFTDGRVGRLPLIYRLTRQGADTVARLTGFEGQRPAKADPRADTVLHRLGMAKIQLAVNDACALRDIPKPAWIHEYNTYPDLARRTKERGEPRSLPASERFILYERFPRADGQAGHASCWPDGSCLLGVGPEACVIYWEYDRSTERLSQVAAKMYGYYPLLTTGTYRKHWPGLTHPNVRVFFVVQSSERLQHIADAIAKMPGAEAVRLATVQDLTPQSLLTERIWRTVKGDCISILRQAPLPVES